MADFSFEENYHEMVYFPLTFSALISPLLSALATTTVVLISLICKFYKRPLSFMVLAINTAHVLFCFSKLSVLVFQPRSSFHCSIIGIINVFGLESAALWGALFAHAFYITLKYQCIDKIPSIMKYYLIIAVLFPLINGIISALTNYFVYSPTAETCVHRIFYGKFDIFVNLYAIFPIWLACIGSIVWYKMAINKISDLHSAEAGGEMWVLMIYPGVMLVCWSPNLVAQTAIQFGATPSSTLTNSFLFLVNLQGFFDAVVYGKSVKEVVRDSISGYFGKKRSNTDETVMLDDMNHRGISSSEEYLLTSGEFVESINSSQ